MTAYRGQEKQVAELAAALAGGEAHHAWILAGPKGLGKMQFALDAARLILDGRYRLPKRDRSFAVSEDGQAAKLLAAGSHPDFRVLQRPLKSEEAGKEVIRFIPHDPADKSLEFKREIVVNQIRMLGPFLGAGAAIATDRVVVIDPADSLERSGANALLKNLEEPPRNVFFFLVSHAPDRLLPTIRSRCRLLRFEPLPDATIDLLLQAEYPKLNAEDRAILVAAAQGSPGKALDYAEEEMAEIERSITKLFTRGDADNAIKSELARSLGTKKAEARFRAFLDRAPSIAATQVKQLSPDRLQEGVAIWSQIADFARIVPRRTLDPQIAVFRIGCLMEELAGHR